MIAAWPCPAEPDPLAEYALALDRARPRRLLIIPALFDEANRLRRFTVEVMRGLDARGIDCFLPDLPGCNESSQPLSTQSPNTWRAAMQAAGGHFRPTHVLAIRGGGLVAPGLPGWHYAPVNGSAILRQLLRARVLASREAGREENQADLLAHGRAAGLDLAGYPLGAKMIAGLEAAEPPALTAISQGDIGGAGLWLRAEPDENAAQSAALADLLAAGMA